MDKELRNKILSQIKPTEEEHFRIQKRVNYLISILKEKAHELGYEVEFFIGGSFGKNTYLKNKSDIDIFARFSQKHKNDDISEMLKKILENSNMKFQKQKGSRDYYLVKIQKLKFEIVPVKKIKNPDDMENTTDVSPLHVEFLKQKENQNKQLSDEIRLAKQFFKAKKIYGAESYINGLSGHVIDILIAYYGSLEKLLLDIKNWEKEKIIDINNHYKIKEDIKLKLDNAKISKLIVIDPLLKIRNAAKALSEENYSKLLIIGNNYNKLKLNDFKIEKFNLNKIIKESKNFAKQNKLSVLFYIFDIDINVDNQTNDIIGSKLLKLQKKLKKDFENYDFRIFLDKFEIDFNQNKSLFIYFIENKKLPQLKKITGPYVYMKESLNNFINKNKIYIVENSRIYSYEKRKVVNIDQISIITKDDCKSMLNRNVDFIKKIKILRKY